LSSFSSSGTDTDDADDFESNNSNTDDYSTTPTTSTTNPPTNTPYTHSEPSITSTTISSSDTIRPRRRRQLPVVDARIVKMDPRTCLCPNCNQPIQNIDLMPSEISFTKLSIFNHLVSKVRTDASPHLKNYADPEWMRKWIQTNGPFKYIIDGANMAYSGASKNSQFSFSQIKALIEKLSQPQYQPGKPLIVLPHSYTFRYLNPNYKGVSVPRSNFRINRGNKGS